VRLSGEGDEDEGEVEVEVEVEVEEEGEGANEGGGSKVGWNNRAACMINWSLWMVAMWFGSLSAAMRGASQVEQGHLRGRLEQEER